MSSKLGIDDDYRAHWSNFLRSHEEYVSEFRYTHRLSPGNKVGPCIELGKIYFHGTSCAFDYGVAIGYFNQALNAKGYKYDLYDDFVNSKSRRQFSKDTFKGALYKAHAHRDTALKQWDKEAIARIQMLKSAGFDRLLNCLRNEIKNSSSSLSSKNSDLINIFEKLCEASDDLVFKIQSDLNDALEKFRENAITAIGDTYKTLVENNLTTFAIKALGVIASICTLGIVNYATDRSIYGLFSSRIDTAVKLESLLTRLGYTPEQEQKNMASYGSVASFL